MDRVPTEILTEIIELLREDPVRGLCCPSPLDKDPFLDNLRNVRLVCRGFRNAASKVFQDTFFTSREILLEKNSLQKLKAIARHRVFRTHLELITVNTFQLSSQLTQWPTFRTRFQTEATSEHPVYLNSKDQNGKKPFAGSGILKAYQSYTFLYNQQIELKTTDTLKAMLAESFELLSGHLKSIHIEASLRTPAQRYITKKIGLSSFPMNDLKDGIEDVIQAIYWSHIDLCSFNISGGLEDQINLEDRIFKYLERSGRSSENHVHNLSLELLPDTVNDDYGSCIRKFVQACPKISYLNLTFLMFNEYPVDIRFLFGVKRLEHLKHLHLFGFSTGAGEFANLLFRHADTLTCLHTHNIILSSGKWASIFRFIHDHLCLDEFELHQVLDKTGRLHTISSDIESYILRRTNTIDWCNLNNSFEKLPSGPEHFIKIAKLFGPAAPGHMAYIIDENPDILVPTDGQTNDQPAVIEVTEYDSDDSFDNSHDDSDDDDDRLDDGLEAYISSEEDVPTDSEVDLETDGNSESGDSSDDSYSTAHSDDSLLSLESE